MRRHTDCYDLFARDLLSKNGRHTTFLPKKNKKLKNKINENITAPILFIVFFLLIDKLPKSP